MSTKFQWNQLIAFVVIQDTDSMTDLVTEWQTNHTGAGSVQRVELFSYLINILKHFPRPLRRTSHDRNVYWPPLR